MVSNMSGNDLIINTPAGRAVLKSEDFEREEDLVMPDGTVVKVYNFKGGQ